MPAYCALCTASAPKTAPRIFATMPAAPSRSSATRPSVNDSRSTFTSASSPVALPDTVKPPAARAML